MIRVSVRTDPNVIKITKYISGTKKERFRGEINVIYNDTPGVGIRIKFCLLSEVSFLSWVGKRSVVVVFDLVSWIIQIKNVFTADHIYSLPNSKVENLNLLMKLLRCGKWCKPIRLLDLDWVPATCILDFFHCLSSTASFFEIPRGRIFHTETFSISQSCRI